MNDVMNKKESPHITALRNQDKLNRMASKRTRVVNGKVEKYTPAPPAQDIEAVVAEVAAAEYREYIANLSPGESVEDRGVFFCTWEPKDRDGVSLGKKFNVYAAPEDLRDGTSRSGLSYENTVKLLAATKNFHGHDGAGYKNDVELYDALRDGSYKGEWFIPPRELLTGTKADGYHGIRNDRIVQPNNLYDSRNKGALKDTFTNMANRYCSSTETQSRQSIWAIWFNNRYEDQLDKTGTHFACRPVRLEEVKP